MRKKTSFFILNNAGSPAKQISIPTSFLRIFICACLIIFGIVMYDYIKLKRVSSLNGDNGTKISSQQREIKNQRKQIQQFAEEITTLKQKLVDLNSFENKIRIIANIEKRNDHDALFGVGGSIPEDIVAQIPLSKKHNSLMREMHEQINQLDLAAANQNNGFESLFKYIKEQQNILASTPAIRPATGWTTSRFGYRISPFTGRREFHKGFDIANRKGTPIIATANGTVTFASKKGAYGNTVVIDHGHGMVTRYAHTHKILVKRNDKVKRGDTIALVGSTGRSTGPHVHYEVHLNGIPVNPEKYILN
ncbi:MAG: M23 family metallopeptidase [Thermodesulfobacteriota bacterium]|nr:M23 family metallopeptidase [Thermodesulfobacteriota bacterium]